jgi:hypothetical protein
LELVVDLLVEHTRTRALDFLALTYPLTECLGLVDIFNRHCPLAVQAGCDSGTILAVMTHSRLAPSPVPLMHMSAFADTYALSELYRRPASAFNDDACGRALDALFPVLPQVWVEIMERVRSVFGLDLTTVHTDVTLIQVEGQFDEINGSDSAAREPARPCYGRAPKGSDPRRKQMALSLSVTPEGLPVWWLAHDGNVADSQQYEQHLFAIRAFLGQYHPVMVGDSKLPTEANRLAFNRAGAFYVGPAGLRTEDTETLRQLWQAGVPCQQLERDRAAQDKGRYWGLESEQQVNDPDEHERCYLHRTVFVFSPDERRTVRHARAKALAKAHAALWQVRSRLNRWHYKTRNFILRQLDQRLGSAAAFVAYELCETLDESGSTRFSLTWRLNREALRKAAEFDGWYRLLTNLPQDRKPMAAVLDLFKGQIHAEGAIKQIKHWPIQVSPLWLHQPKRIESLLGLTVIALLLTAVLAQQLRQAIAREPQPPAGLQPEGRDHLPVTARRLWQIMVGLHLVTLTMCAADGARWQLTTIDTLNSAQHTVFRLLGWPQPTDYLPAGLQPLSPT